MDEEEPDYLETHLDCDEDDDGTLEVDDDHLALVIADVSGKGIPAAMFMMTAKSLIKNQARSGEGPGEILGHVNDQICEGNDAELSVTVWLALIEVSTGRGVAVNAGHEHPALRRTGSVFLRSGMRQYGIKSAGNIYKAAAGG